MTSKGMEGHCYEGGATLDGGTTWWHETVGVAQENRLWDVRGNVGGGKREIVSKTR
jgi:hypothetical protein